MAVAQVAIADLRHCACPPLCVRCGAAAERSRFVTVSHTAKANPVFGVLFDLLGHVVAAIQGTIVLRIPLPVCRAHIGRFAMPDARLQFRAVLAGLGLFVAWVAVAVVTEKAVAAGELLPGIAFFGGGLLCLFVILFSARWFSRRMIGAAEINERFVVLTNVSPEFAAAVDAEREAAKRAKSG